MLIVPYAQPLNLPDRSLTGMFWGTISIGLIYRSNMMLRRMAKMLDVQKTHFTLVELIIRYIVIRAYKKAYEDSSSSYFLLNRTHYHF